MELNDMLARSAEIFGKMHALLKDHRGEVNELKVGEDKLVHSIDGKNETITLHLKEGFKLAFELRGMLPGVSVEGAKISAAEVLACAASDALQKSTQQAGIDIGHEALKSYGVRLGTISDLRGRRVEVANNHEVTNFATAGTAGIAILKGNRFRSVTITPGEAPTLNFCFPDNSDSWKVTCSPEGNVTKVEGMDKNDSVYWEETGAGNMVGLLEKVAAKSAGKWNGLPGFTQTLGTPVEDDIFAGMDDFGFGR